MRRDLAVLLSVCAAACQWPGVEPLPLRGPAPRLILIAPVEATAAPDAGLQGFDPAALLVGAEPALRARGYAVLPLQVGFDLLRQHQLTAAASGDDAGELASIASATGADAVLRVTAARFTFVQSSMLERASYDLHWQLLATSGAELWDFDLNADYVRPEDTSMPVEAGHEDEQLPVPIGVPRPRPFRDAADLLANLHRAAFARLPAGGR